MEDKEEVWNGLQITVVKCETKILNYHPLTKGICRGTLTKVREFVVVPSPHFSCFSYLQHFQNSQVTLMMMILYHLSYDVRVDYFMLALLVWIPYLFISNIIFQVYPIRHLVLYYILWSWVWSWEMLIRRSIQQILQFLLFIIYCKMYRLSSREQRMLEY